MGIATVLCITGLARAKFRLAHVPHDLVSIRKSSGSITFDAVPLEVNPYKTDSQHSWLKIGHKLVLSFFILHQTFLTLRIEHKFVSIPLLHFSDYLIAFIGDGAQMKFLRYFSK